MFVSTTVVSTRILRPCTTAMSFAMRTILWWIFLMISGPSATPQRPMVLASGILANPRRVKLRYKRLVRTSRSSVA
jgi:hypothetical protein